MTHKNRRIGLIVPSSNVTMETEIPALLRNREEIFSDRFTFHSSRMRMKSVVKEELERMDDDSVRCAFELSDAAVEVQAYACLVAIMSRGHGYHKVSEQRLFKATKENGMPTPSVNSAGALIDGMHSLGMKKVSIIIFVRRVQLLKILFTSSNLFMIVKSSGMVCHQQQASLSRSLHTLESIT